VYDVNANPHMPPVLLRPINAFHVGWLHAILGLPCVPLPNVIDPAGAYAVGYETASDTRNLAELAPLWQKLRASNTIRVEVLP
jgi:hypothetical protein